LSAVQLRGEALQKRYGRVAALRGVDFLISSGEAIAILGANGAGKSSLLKILAGLSRPSGGHFEALPETGGAALPRERLRGLVGYVGHATLVYGELSARENLLFAARLYGQRPSRERLDQVLADFALLDVADRRAGTFSRGLAQRLSIARAVVHEPSLLLLDEPFTGLDELSATRLSEQLAAQRSSGRTLVVVTHDPRRASELADRALLLHRGRLCASLARDTGSDFAADALRARLAEVAREGEDAGASSA
jgi:ABC-type multidrug transport system ATPase subunit